MPHSSFFKKHDPEFVHNDSNTLQVEFGRLANRCGWTKKNKKYPRQWVKCLTEELKCYVYQIIDEDGDKLSNMRLLCERYANKTPSSIGACEKALRHVHINLVDWIDSQRYGEEPRRFRSYRDLENYTRENNRFFPKKILNDVPIMKVFLRAF
ncbi:hypothetical protein MGYG_00862 [Nannizzia gypsea CBS 118893]|uniref:Uncharacterized protein n=1 Tax=Arthroderma gypseum (strain ATCC MYA-4604 / CBS 118893) TaxID=535722 RepID=E5R2F0_ARTGP|nr:hypothetical protein MGYG_00862 [Nannizzia gypsea CBS 118893]EFQ97826.1 hypothetical protein MGYG_00862 [Nannizzia gypsea CBS 118893]